VVCVKRVPFTGGKVMSGNLSGFRSSGRSTAARIRGATRADSAGFAALLTFPELGFFEKSLLATSGGPMDKVVAGINPATIATLVRPIS
jgi:hypothetical protein